MYKSKCQYCGNEFTGTRSDKKYCSNTCKAYAHQHKNSLGNVPAPAVKTKTIVVDEVVKVPNSSYKQLKHIVEQIEADILKLKESRQTIINQLARGLSSNANTIAGGALGAGIGLVISQEQGKKNHLPNVLAGLLIGGALGKLIDNNDDQTNKIYRKIEAKKQQLEALDDQISNAEVVLSMRLEQLRATNKWIETTVQKEREVIDESDLDTLKSNVASQLAAIPIARKLEPEPEQQPQPQAKVMTANEILNKQYVTYPFSGDWYNLIGLPEVGFSAIIYGPSGHGKSTFAMRFARYLTQFGRVLIISSEEGHRKTMQDKILHSGATNIEGDKIVIAEANNLNEVQAAIKAYSTPFVVIDSINHLNISVEELEGLKTAYKGNKTTFIAIMQATKEGEIRGNSQYKHNTDLVLRIENQTATVEKNRFALVKA